MNTASNDYAIQNLWNKPVHLCISKGRNGTSTWINPTEIVAKSEFEPEKKQFYTEQLECDNQNISDSHIHAHVSAMRSLTGKIPVINETNLFESWRK